MPPLEGMTPLYFALNENQAPVYYSGTPLHPGGWSLPTRARDGRWTPGAWMPAVAGAVQLYHHGYHAWGAQDVPDGLAAHLYVVELRGDLQIGPHVVVGREMRLLAKTAWDAQRARLFAADCAEWVFALFAAVCPEDGRVRTAITIARLVATGLTDEGARAAAENAAAESAQDAGDRYTTVPDAAMSAAWFAARTATCANEERAHRAAASAGAAAVEAAGYAVAPPNRLWAKAAARQWQADRVLAYCEERMPQPLAPIGMP